MRPMRRSDVRPGVWFGRKSDNGGTWKVIKGPPENFEYKHKNGSNGIAYWEDSFTESYVVSNLYYNYYPYTL